MVHSGQLVCKTLRQVCEKDGDRGVLLSLFIVLSFSLCLCHTNNVMFAFALHFFSAFVSLTDVTCTILVHIYVQLCALVCITVMKLN